MLAVKKKILIFTDWFFPAYKGGGPIQSCLNLTQLLKEDFNIFILTSDRDFGDHEALDNITSNQWLDFDTNIKVKYISQEHQTFKNISQEISTLQPNYIYLNSMYSKVFSIYPLLWYRISNHLGNQLILAPRGMLQTGAMQYKSIKKNTFLFLLRLLGFTKNIFFHATDKQEKLDIINHLKVSNKQVSIISNVPIVPKENFKTINKNNLLKLVFISRISPKKNLDFLLSILKSITFDIVLKIIGNIENLSYWDKCQQIISTLPKNVKIEFAGSLNNKEVQKELKRNHFFILPTLGENFGHAIFESFAAGRPVIISDQTPWKNLSEKKIGWSIPLHQPEKFIQAIKTAAQMNQEDYDTWSKSSWQFAKDYVENSNLRQQYLTLFS